MIKFFTKLLTDLGKIIVLRLERSANATSATVRTPSYISSSSSPIHFAKAVSPISVTLPGIFSVVISLHPINADFPVW